MLENINDAKEKVLERMKTAIGPSGVERMDVAEMEKLADIVKDLSEAEKECWEAQYYMSVTQAMNSGSGYTPETYAAQGYMPEPMSYDTMRTVYGVKSGYRDTMGRYATSPSNMGYDGMRYGYDMQGLREAMSTASPEEREKMMREMRTMLGM